MSSHLSVAGVSPPRQTNWLESPPNVRPRLWAWSAQLPVRPLQAPPTTADFRPASRSPSPQGYASPAPPGLRQSLRSTASSSSIAHAAASVSRSASPVGYTSAAPPSLRQSLKSNASSISVGRSAAPGYTTPIHGGSGESGASCLSGGWPRVASPIITVRAVPSLAHTPSTPVITAPKSRATVGGAGSSALVRPLSRAPGDSTIASPSTPIFPTRFSSPSARAPNQLGNVHSESAQRSSSTIGRQASIPPGIVLRNNQDLALVRPPSSELLTQRVSSPVVNREPVQAVSPERSRGGPFNVAYIASQAGQRTCLNHKASPNVAGYVDPPKTGGTMERFLELWDSNDPDCHVPEQANDEDCKRIMAESATHIESTVGESTNGYEGDRSCQLGGAVTEKEKTIQISGEANSPAPMGTKENASNQHSAESSVMKRPSKHKVPRFMIESSPSSPTSVSKSASPCNARAVSPSTEKDKRQKRFGSDSAPILTTTPKRPQSVQRAMKSDTFVTSKARGPSPKRLNEKASPKKGLGGFSGRGARARQPSPESDDKPRAWQSAEVAVSPQEAIADAKDLKIGEAPYLQRELRLDCLARNGGASLMPVAGDKIDDASDGENSADSDGTELLQAVRSMADQTPKDQRQALVGSALFRLALENVVPAELAMHPQRARGGSFLLHQVGDALAANVPEANSDDGQKVVERLFLDSMPAEHVRIECIKPVCRSRLLERFLERISQERASVEATFHGTSAAHVDQILQEGLHPEMCHTGAYGRGAYVGTHAGVAHQYADADTEGLRHMCVILVVCGSHVVKGKEGQNPEATALDRLVNPTQYCLIDEGRLYVSHVITYRTLDAGRHRIGGGWEDPFQACLSNAVRRAARRRSKRGLR